MFIGLSAAFLVYFSLISMMSLCLYILQVVSITGTLRETIPIETLTETDKYLLAWL